MYQKPLFKNFLWILSISVIINGCGIDRRPTAEKGITEGSIVYSITYPETINNSLSFLFPREMTLHFSNGNQRAIFKGSMDLYGLDFIHRCEQDSFFTLLKILEKRMYVPTPRTLNMFIFGNDGSEVEIIADNSNSKEIAGFKCKMASIIPHNPGNPAFQIWYTTEIGIDYPHRNTPFEKIPGIMMDFKMTYEDVVFHLQAKKVVEESHSDEFFRVPHNFERGSIKEIEELIKTVLN